jgi:putative DNA primase/helicase
MARSTCSTRLRQLPFDQNVDRAVALSLALCALVRRSLPSAPLGAITAPTPSSGKTLLADCISILATGSAAPAMSYAETTRRRRRRRSRC